jgi:hypothetical protein
MGLGKEQRDTTRRVDRKTCDGRIGDANACRKAVSVAPLVAECGQAVNRLHKPI